jgi:uncharacterized membrane protein YgcG
MASAELIYIRILSNFEAKKKPAPVLTRTPAVLSENKGLFAFLFRLYRGGNRSRGSGRGGSRSGRGGLGGGAGNLLSGGRGGGGSGFLLFAGNREHQRDQGQREQYCLFHFSFLL